MIKLDDIKSRSVVSLLEKYNGCNIYIKKLKNDLIVNKKISLTDNQVKYISENYNKEPITINRVIGVTKYLGEELKKLDNLSFIPERIFVETILSDNDKTYHVYGKLNRNQKESKLYWLPKTQVTEDPYFQPINIDIDFKQYNDVLGKQGKKLYQHQEEGIKFLLSRNNSILAFDMGLGKTTCAIVAAMESKARRILIITPSATKINWEREINVFSSNTTIVDGKKWDEAKFVIINFDILKNFHTISNDKKNKDEELIVNREIVNYNFDLCIIDEAHYIKNYDSIRGKIINELSTKYNLPKFWLLTGTPIANRPKDFFNLLKVIKSPVADNWQHYIIRYCDGKKMFRTLKNGQKKQIWISDGASNLDELAIKTKNVMLRKLKEDALDMPDKIVTPVYHNLSDSGWDEYNKLWDDYVEKKRLDGKKVFTTQKDLVELILLRRFIALQAIPFTIEMCENAIEMGKKVIIFTTFTEELEAIADHFGKLAVKHNGPMSGNAKQISVDEFQNNDKVKVFVGNLNSAGVGITLVSGTVTIFNSFGWVPGQNEQAEDRSFRIGQKNNVNIYYQLFDKTVSTKMWFTLKNKKDIISTILGDKELSDEEISNLITEKIIEEEDGNS